MKTKEQSRRIENMPASGLRFAEFFIRRGRFEADRVGLQRIVRRRGTPCYVYSASVIRCRLRLLQRYFSDFTVCYSLKANPNVEICRLLRSGGAGAEVSSEAELTTALQAGFKPQDIVYVAPAKRKEDVTLAVATGIRALVADAVEDLEMIEKEAARRKREVSVLLRINTFERRPEAKEVMVGGPSKFGFDEEEVINQVRPVRNRWARIAGIQVYSASQVLDAGFLAEHIVYVVELARRISQELGCRLETVDFGGGFGIPYTEQERELDLAQVVERVRPVISALRRDYPGCRMLLESGRYLVAEAGVFLTRIVRVKRSRGRILAICDGGMNSFSRPVFMRIRHPARLLNRPLESAATEVDICGPICTPLDCLGRGEMLPEPRVGDIVGFVNTGAYGYTMSLLDFMSRPRPAELLADSGRLRVIREPGR